MEPGLHLLRQQGARLADKKAKRNQGDGRGCRDTRGRGSAKAGSYDEQYGAPGWLGFPAISLVLTPLLMAAGGGTGDGALPRVQHRLVDDLT